MLQMRESAGSRKRGGCKKGIEAEIEYITDMARIMEYGIMSASEPV